MDDEGSVLRELVREAERYVDHQVRLMAASDEKSLRMVTLCAAALGGGLALGSLAVGGGPPVGGAAILLALAGLANLAALLAILDGYVGLRNAPELRVALDPRWLLRKAVAEGWTLNDQLRSVLAGFAHVQPANEEVLRHRTARQRQSLLRLSLALVGYAMTFVYILAALMQW